VSAGSHNGFPKHFRFGAATAAFQIEGAAGRGQNIWDTFCRVPGAVLHGDTGDVACDHVNRWRDDIDLMQSLSLEAYRFSIAWSRVMPSGSGSADQNGVDFYRRLVERLLERGIEPIATLYHWDLPQPLEDAGGWPVRETAERFAEYAHLMATELGDMVVDWITHNEPWVASFLGYAEGVKAPGGTDWAAGRAASHHMLLSHGLATKAVRAAVRDARVGIALNLAPVRAASESEADRLAAARRDGYLNRWFLDPVLRGRYPQDMLDLFEKRFGTFGELEHGDLAAISVPTDFLGVNYYRPETVRAAVGAGPLEFEIAAHGELTAMGWEVDPRGLRELLGRLREDYRPMPVYITENGAAFDDPEPNGEPWVDDPRREAYLESHIDAMRSAIADGSDVRRYYVWSLLDNFEWEFGYSKRFGIVHVDFETQQRLPKRSGLWYRDFIQQQRGAASREGGD
jgi:beta-glucosidase